MKKCNFAVTFYKMDIVKKDIGGNAEAEVVLYQPDSSIHIEVLVEGETVWLTQQQIADLFGTKRPAITKHLNKQIQFYHGKEI